MKQSLILKQPLNNNNTDPNVNLVNLNINLENNKINDSINNLSDLNQNLSTIENINISIELSSEEILKLKKDLNELSRSAQINEDNKLNMDLSTFKEAFPNFSKEPEIFNKVQDLSKNIENSEIWKKLLEEKGLVNFLKTEINRDPNSGSKELLESILKITEEKLESLKNNSSFAENQSLGEFGETTLNEAFNQGFKNIKPLSESKNNLGLNISTYGNLITVLFMYNSICKIHARLIQNKGPNSANMQKMSLKDKLVIERDWARTISRFKLLFAPLIVASLFSIKSLVLDPKVTIILESKPELTNEDLVKSLSFLGFLKKLPDFIGKFVIGVIIIRLIKFLIEKYSINIMDSLYVTIYSLIVIAISSIFCLEYLLKILIILFFKYFKNISISAEKLPIKLYNFLSYLKAISVADFSFINFYIFHFWCYLFLIFLHIIILFLL